MPTEPVELKVLLDPSVRERYLNQLEESDGHFAEVHCEVEKLSELGSVLCAFRARNVSVLLHLDKNYEAEDDVQAASAIACLHEWDQLSLQSVLILCRRLIPESALKMLEAESKIEQMWMREWFTASENPQIGKIPGLPWRRFIRKVVFENFEFADGLFQIQLSDEPEEVRHQKLKEHLIHFLQNKKKVVSIFPKKWSKNQ